MRVSLKTLNIEYPTLKKIPAVYIITNNVNGKSYVGETVNLKRRMEEYIYPNRRDGRIIHKALNKYGIDNFMFEFYYFPSFQKEDLLQLEEYMIQSYNSLIPNGYNICPKGTSSVGVKFSKETREKMKKSRIKEVHKYDALSGKYIESYISVDDAAESSSGSASNISVCSNGGRKTAYGFIWSYKKVDLVAPVERVGVTLAKKIQQRSLNGNIIGGFLTLNEAARSVGGNHSNICNVCNGKNKSAYGYLWLYV